MGIYTFWVKVFVLPKEVVNQVTKLCRNYLWSADCSYSKNPYVAWAEVCLPKTVGGIGLKNLEVWNKAWIAKLVWEIAMKKDILWIRWVHGKYLINKDL